MLVLYTMSGFCGSTTGTGRSPPPIFMAGRGSSVIFRQLIPPSSERYTPNPLSVAYPLPSSLVANVAYSRCGSLAEIATLICTRSFGRPFVSGFQVVPPSVDLKSPPFVRRIIVVIFPWSQPLIPQRCIHDLRILWIDDNVGAAGIFILVQNLFPGFAAIGRAKNPALCIGAVRMSEHCREQPVRILVDRRQSRESAGRRAGQDASRFFPHRLTDRYHRRRKDRADAVLRRWRHIQHCYRRERPRLRRSTAYPAHRK